MNERPITEADLHAHVDGRLAPEREAEVGAWLLVHPEEASKAAAYCRQSDALRAALAPVIDEPLPPSLDLGLRRRPASRWNSFRQMAMAASAAGLLMAGGSGGWVLRGWNQPANVGTAALAQEGMASYAVYASDTERPVEIAAADRRTLDSWFSERLARPVRAPDLRSVGLTLMGGRLVATEHGPAGLYLYRDRDARRVALYLRPMEVDRSDRMTERRSGAVSGWTWADNGLGFGIFGSSAQHALHGTADIARAQMSHV